MSAEVRTEVTESRINPLKSCYTVKEVAEILHIHPNTVYSLVKRNILKPIRVTRWFRFPKAQVNAIMDSCSTGDAANHQATDNSVIQEEPRL